MMSHVTLDPYSYETYEEIADYLLSKVSVKPKVGIICGTGLGVISEAIENPLEIPYSQIPHFPQCTATGHQGKLIFGKLAGADIMCMKGRFHGYEGYPTWLLAMPVRVMKLCGVTHLIISNAAGGLNQSYATGDIMIMKDHVNFFGLAGRGPLVGPHDDRWGPRFTPMVRAYNRDLIRRAKELWDAKYEGTLREGVYACLGGPQFETIAEMKMLAVGGVDAVGMSTAHEVTFAVQCGIQVFGFTLITNMCVLDYDTKEDLMEEHVLAVGKERQGEVTSFVLKIVQYISSLDK